MNARIGKIMLVLFVFAAGVAFLFLLATLGTLLFNHVVNASACPC